ncbi:hypothetical protein PAMA_003625 [Pampus argenteus]
MLLLLLLSLTATTYVSGSEEVCTVTGSQIINFKQGLVVVPDRCAYSLFASGTSTVSAVFQDRRLVDVSLLDHVVIKTSAGAVQLGPGWRVIKDGNDVDISKTPTVNTVALTKETIGIKATFTVSANTIEVIFDGFTLYIKKPDMGSVVPGGLCMGSSLSTTKISSLSIENCAVAQSKTNEVPSDTCTTVTTRCEKLSSNPFGSCAIAKTNYIKACKDTLCKYPEKDGFSVCRFQEAYVNVCQLLGTTISATWRTDVGCTDSTTFCQDKTCAHHEFCGDNISDEESCLCRSIFATPLRTDNSFGGVTTCEDKSSKLILANCLLEEKGIDYNDLHLKKATCTGQLDTTTNNVTFSFDNTDTCEAIVTETVDTNTQGVTIKYENSVETSAPTGDITRVDSVNIDFSCQYTPKNPSPTTFTIMDSTVTKTFSTVSWTYTVTMSAYTNAKRTKLVETSTEIQLKQTIWMELKATGVDETSIALVIHSCQATDVDSAKTHNLITNGCQNPADSTVKIETNGKGVSGLFNFKMFQFIGKAKSVKLECILKLCSTLDSKNCQPDCSSRRRRSAKARYVDTDPAVISMAWTN